MLTTPLFAQDETKKNDESLPNELGFNAGFTTGLGFSYRRWFSNFGLQATTLPLKISDETFISAALSGMYSLKCTRHVRTYLYWGNHFLLNSSTSHSPDSSGTTITQTETHRHLNSGVGIGFSFGRVVAFNMQFGFAAYNLLGKKEDINLLPTGELGLYYRF